MYNCACAGFLVRKLAKSAPAPVRCFLGFNGKWEQASESLLFHACTAESTILNTLPTTMKA